MRWSNADARPFSITGDATSLKMSINRTGKTANWYNGVKSEFCSHGFGEAQGEGYDEPASGQSSGSASLYMTQDGKGEVSYDDDLNEYGSSWETEDWNLVPSHGQWLAPAKYDIVYWSTIELICGTYMYKPRYIEKFSFTAEEAEQRLATEILAGVWDRWKNPF